MAACSQRPDQDPSVEADSDTTESDSDADTDTEADTDTILCLDGVYVRKAEGLRSVRDRQVTTEEVAGLVVELATRAESWLSRQGFGAHDGEEEHGDVDDELPLMQAASIQGRSAVA